MLLKKTTSRTWLWPAGAEAAFRELQTALTSASALAMPNFTEPFLIECDASGMGLGAVLMQQGRPVAYFSKGLADRTLAKSAYEKEMMALILAVQHWRPYLLGLHFTVRTD